MVKIFFKNISNHIVILFFCILLLSGCRRKVYVTSNTFADVKTIPKGFSIDSSFYITSLNQINKLLSNEISQKISVILTDKGYVIRDAKDADFLLVFNFAIEESKQIINIPQYIPGQTSTTTGTVRNPYGFTAAQYQQQTTSSGNIIYIPVERMFYSKGIVIYVYDANEYRKTKKEELIWQGSAVTCDESNDLREAIDYLLVAASQDFGRSTGRNKQIQINVDNKLIEKLSQGIYSALSQQFKECIIA
ncbi:MAG: hypothetical protein WDZ41_02645 [Candidatus Babeliales bacterium]